MPFHGIEPHLFSPDLCKRVGIEPTFLSGQGFAPCMSFTRRGNGVSPTEDFGPLRPSLVIDWWGFLSAYLMPFQIFFIHPLTHHSLYLLLASTYSATRYSVFIRTLLRYLTLTLRHAPTCYVNRREPNELTEHYRADSLWRTALPFARVRIYTLHNAIVNNSSLVVLSMRLMCLSVYLFRHLAEQSR